MRYKPMGRNRSYNVAIPLLSGGLNLADHPQSIADNELSAAQNVQWENGVLKKRQAVRAVGISPFVSLSADDSCDIADTADSISSHPMDIGGEMCVIVHSGSCYGSSTTPGMSNEYVHVVSLDGEVKATYKQNEAWGVDDAAFVPCDPNKYGCPFLMYQGTAVYKPDDETHTMKVIGDNDLYAPLVMINGKGVLNGTDQNGAVSGGVMYEGFNLLTKRFRAQFTSQGGEQNSYAESYKLPTALDPNSYVRVSVVTTDGETTLVCKVGESLDPDHTGTPYYISVKKDGVVSLRPCPPKSLVSNNITITATAAKATSASQDGPTFGVWFGGTQNKLGGTRVFLAGFAKDRAKLIWSDVNNPLYLPENNYMFVGDVSQRITALDKQGDMLVVFKERELFCTTYVQGEIDDDSVANGTNVDVTVSQAHFPLKQLSPYIGCDAPHSVAVCRDRLVWCCTDGRVYTLSDASPHSECNVREIGQAIGSLAATHEKALLRRASAMDYNGSYTLMIGNTAYSFNYRDGGLERAAASYGGKTATKALEWYVYRYEGFDETEKLRVVSDGAYKALVISTQERKNAFTHIRMLYRFEEHTADSHAGIRAVGSGATASLTTTVTDVAIVAKLTTKLYDFGHAESYKSVDSVFLIVQGEELFLTFEADTVPAKAVQRVTAGAVGGKTVFPGVKRCRSFSMTITTSKELALRGFCLRYTLLGSVH